MSKTIVQAFGPIYGEPVNGTVQGRPNGSVYVPLSNTIHMVLDEDYRYMRSFDNGTISTCASDGNFSVVDARHFKINAQSQDLASHISVELYSDEELTTQVGYWDVTAGLFDYSWRYIMKVDPDFNIVNGDPYYLVAKLMNSGSAVATSEVIPITGYAE